MLSYYQALGIPRDSPSHIVRMAHDSKLRALAKAPLSPEERRIEERLLQEALVTLSDPATKSWYDRQLLRRTQPAGESSLSPSKTAWFAIVLVAAILTTGAAYTGVERGRERSRLQIEEQRLAVERARLQAEGEIEQARLQDSQRQLQDRREYDYRATFERDRANYTREQRINEDRAYQYQARQRTLESYDRRERNMAEDRDRYLAEENRRRAWADVERQNQFVRQRELEEERIRTERHYRAQAEMEAAARRRTPYP